MQFNPLNDTENDIDKFNSKIVTITSHGYISLAIELGRRLGLFHALAKCADADGSESSGASAEDIARNSGTKTRYVKEWLCLMSCAEIIECDPSGQKFWIPKDHFPALIGREFDDNGERNLENIALMAFMPLMATMFDKVCSVFKLDGPIGIDYTDYTSFDAEMDVITKVRYQNKIVSELVPMMGIEEQLKSGIEVLDVGCGAGFHLLEIASAFPNSKYTGVDLSVKAIEQAKKALEQRTLKSSPISGKTEFLAANGIALPANWSARFDVILNFDAFHDQHRPDLCLDEMYRCLKPGGLLAMVEVNGTGNCYKDRHMLGPVLSSILYSYSIFYCLPVGSNSADSLQFGTMWGTEKGRSMLESRGFEEISIAPIPFLSQMHALYKAQKPQNTQ